MIECKFFCLLSKDRKICTLSLFKNRQETNK